MLEMVKASLPNGIPSPYVVIDTDSDSPSPSITVTLNEPSRALDQMGLTDSVSATRLYHTILQLHADDATMRLII
jgi:hypothetical protein